MVKAWSPLVSVLDLGMTITILPEEKGLKGLRFSKLIWNITKQLASETADDHRIQQDQSMKLG